MLNKWCIIQVTINVSFTTPITMILFNNTRLSVLCHLKAGTLLREQHKYHTSFQIHTTTTTTTTTYQFEEHSTQLLVLQRASPKMDFTFTFHEKICQGTKK
jgi:hypothetical protein